MIHLGPVIVFLSREKYFKKERVGSVAVYLHFCLFKIDRWKKFSLTRNNALIYLTINTSNGV